MSRKVLWIGIPILLVGVVLLYYGVDPAHTAWLPRCWFHEWTGWQCPACGGQRALHSLLHGHLARALHYNLFLIVSVPYFLAAAWTSFDRGVWASRLRPIVQHRCVAWGYCLLFVVWWVVRNLPGVNL